MNLAFSRNDGLYVVGSDGTGARVVYPAKVYDPAWSPDGATIAIPCGADVCGVKPDGTGVAKLTNSNLPASAAIADPAWSPDGSRIAFTSYQFQSPDFGGTYYGLGEIAVMNRDGSGVTRLTPGIWGGNPSWSPDGTRIVFNTLVFSKFRLPP